jgi:hypothetical protein
MQVFSAGNAFIVIFVGSDICFGAVFAPFVSALLSLKLFGPLGTCRESEALSLTDFATSEALRS